MKILVTGADGFAGRYLCRFLNDNGHSVIGVGLNPNIHIPGMEYHIIDIFDETMLPPLIQKEKPELIYHLAGIASTTQCEKDFVSAGIANSLGMAALGQELLDLDYHCPVIVFSSGEVYGPNAALDKPHTENSPLAPPLNFYTATRLAQEDYARYLAEKYDFSIVLLRPFSMVGPGQTDKFVMAAWAKQINAIKAGEQEPIMHVGNLDVYRDFNDVRNAMRNAAALADADIAKPGLSIFNVSSNQAISLKEVLDMFISYADQDVKVEVDQALLRKSDYPIFFGSQAKLEMTFDVKNEIPIEQTIKDIIEGSCIVVSSRMRDAL